MLQYVGIDIGSTATKVALLDKDGSIGKLSLRPTGFSSAETASAIKGDLAASGIDPASDGVKVVATGYGRVAVPYADRTVTEITCHGTGAAFLFGEKGTVIDVGGQDTKVIVLSHGKVIRFLMNDKCAAGTGRFLEVMADRLGVTQQALSDLARAGKPTKITSMCTVFAESEVISLVGKGERRENIANGVIDSVVSRISSLARQGGGTPYFLTGGLCDNAYIVEELERHLGSTVTTEPRARYAGAIGAALQARRLFPSMG